MEIAFYGIAAGTFDFTASFEISGRRIVESAGRLIINAHDAVFAPEFRVLQQINRAFSWGEPRVPQYDFVRFSVISTQIPNGIHPVFLRLPHHTDIDMHIGQPGAEQFLQIQNGAGELVISARRFQGELTEGAGTFIFIATVFVQDHRGQLVEATAQVRVVVTEVEQVRQPTFTIGAPNFAQVSNHHAFVSGLLVFPVRTEHVGTFSTHHVTVTPMPTGFFEPVLDIDGNTGDFTIRMDSVQAMTFTPTDEARLVQFQFTVSFQFGGQVLSDTVNFTFEALFR